MKKKKAQHLVIAALACITLLVGVASPASAVLGSVNYGTFPFNCRGQIQENSQWILRNFMNREGTNGCVANWTMYRNAAGEFKGLQNHGNVNDSGNRFTPEPMVQAVGRAYINGSEYYWGRTEW